MYELKERDGLGRCGLITIGKKRVETPVLFPVINPKMSLVSPAELREMFGARAIITNSYIIYRSELRDFFLENGIHRGLGFNGVVMTDSGTFQDYVYGDVDVSNEEILSFQERIGSDIVTVLDVFSRPDDDYERARACVEETVSRVRNALSLAKNSYVVAPIQGALYKDLRVKCAKALAKVNASIYAVGGVVPLMENYRFGELVDVIMWVKMNIPPSKPLHLFGAGHPMMFALAVLLGCDSFDSASYAKFARDDRLLTPMGTVHLKSLDQFPCECSMCTKYEPSDVMEMEKKERERVLALHNLYIMFAEIRRIRTAIKEGRLWEIVALRARSHPRLLDALRRLGKYKRYMERFEPMSRYSGMLYTGPETLHRPIIYRYERRVFERYRPSSGTALFRKTILGPVPVELSHTYPFAQCEGPDDWDSSARRHFKRLERRFSERLGMVKYAGDDYQVDELALLRAIADYQFGLGSGDALFPKHIRIVRSKRTGKIRAVYEGEMHIVSMRAEDFFLTLHIWGGIKLHRYLRPPSYRVVVSNKVAELNREGKNVFAKFVLDCDDNIRPRDEVLVVDESDELVAVGKATMNREEMLSFSRGMAVKVREGVNEVHRHTH
ncbi:MAG: tRNA guanosine(15) transglycosylase TgtA [Thermoplasmata archaeon]|nr:MAG: tRNA guanosine(15) transglycosylase TgtA [Thermoplasmata archaeon]